jgi:transcriptional regulator
MYIPNHFREDDREELVAFMRRHDFATVVSILDGESVATHLPLVVTCEGEEVILRGHFAKANPQWSALDNSSTLAIFAGPHAYVSPAHYDKRESVPTWNYLAVHAHGQARLVDGEAAERLLDDLIAQHEPPYQKQWDGLSDRYRRGMLQGIVGFEMRVGRLEGAAKLSQNKSREEQERIIRSLLESGDQSERDTGAEMRRRLKRAQR